jgi:c-di-GMP-binding flagellar brake protein YcgR
MTERRRYERVAFYCGVQVFVLPDGPLLLARAFDISLGGVGVTCDQSLTRGQSVRASFRLRDKSDRWAEEHVLARVAYCQADEGGNRIGIEFTEKIQESIQPVLTRTLNAL